MYIRKGFAVIHTYAPFYKIIQRIIKGFLHIIIADTERKHTKQRLFKKALGADANVSKLLSAASGNSFMLLHEQKKGAAAFAAASLIINYIFKAYRLTVILVFNMHVKLIIRYCNSVFIKRLSYFLKQVKLKRKIIACFAPYLHRYINRACSVFGNSCKR